MSNYSRSVARLVRTGVTELKGGNATANERQRAGLPRVRSHGPEVFHRAGDGKRQHLTQPPTPANVGPVFQDVLGLPAAGAAVVFADERVDPLVVDVVAVDHHDALRVELGGGFG